MAWIVAGGALLVAPATAAQGDNPLTAFLARPRHIVVSTSASAAAARPGASLTLTVDVTPNPGIHVYAPGAKGYRPIALNISALPHVTLGKTAYPKSELVLFANERVPVYQKPFRISRTLTIGGAAVSGTVAIAGTIDYQACDDTVCFAPESIPVSWSVAVR